MTRTAARDGTSAGRGHGETTPGDELGAALERLSGADLYRNNAFRVTGLPSDATPARIRRSREEAVLRARLGTPGPPAGPDGPDTPDGSPPGAHPPGPPPGTEEIRAAFETLRDPVARLTHELLWPWHSSAPAWSGSQEHEQAVRAHREAVEAEFAAAPAPGSAEERRLDGLWTSGLTAWASVLSSRELWDHARARVTRIGDPRLTTGTVRRLRERLPRHLASVTAELALRAERTTPGTARRLVDLLRATPFPDEVVADALRAAARPAERTIRAACAIARDTVGADEARGGAAGGELLARIDEPLRLVQALCGQDAALTTALSEEVAVLLNQCAVAHHHAQGPPRVALDLLARAARLARVRRTTELVAANTASVESSSRSGLTGPATALPVRLREMCERGQVEKAAGHLRAVAAAVRDQEAARRLRTLATDRRSVAAPVRAEPFCGSFLGFGVRLYGKGPDADGVICATYALTLLYLPVFPLGAYLMNGRGVHARVPLGTGARWWRRALFLAPLLVLVLCLPGAESLPALFALVAGLASGAAERRRQRVRAWAAWHGSR